MKTLRRSILFAVLAAVCGLAGSFPLAQGNGSGADQMKPPRRRQIELMQEKAARSWARRKMASQLIYGMKMHRGERITADADRWRSPRNARGRDCRHHGDVGPELLRAAAGRREHPGVALHTACAPTWRPTRRRHRGVPGPSSSRCRGDDQRADVQGTEAASIPSISGRRGPSSRSARAASAPRSPSCSRSFRPASTTSASPACANPKRI